MEKELLLRMQVDKLFSELLPLIGTSQLKPEQAEVLVKEVSTLISDTLSTVGSIADSTKRIADAVEALAYVATRPK